MYSREEASQLRQAFWTAFGQYMSPQRSSEGLRVNWINYKTGLKHVYFKMDADKKSASIAITLTHPDSGIQELFFEQFQELKSMLHGYLGEEWHWVLHTSDENGRTISRIYTEISGVSIFNRNDWPAMISFFKPRITALDEFWNDTRDVFEPLK